MRENSRSYLHDPSITPLLDMNQERYFLDLRSKGTGGGVLGVYRQMTTQWDDIRGGILCEEMGSGKTIICLSLILHTKDHFSKPLSIDAPIHCLFEKDEYIKNNLSRSSFPARRGVPTLYEQALVATRIAGRPYARKKDQLGIYSLALLDDMHVYYFPVDNRTSSTTTALPRRRRTNKNEKAKVYLSKSTLVIVPPNLMDQWTSEIYKHTISEENALNFLVIDAQPIPDPLELMKYDLVLIAQNRFSAESMRKKVGKELACDDCQDKYLPRCDHLSWTESPLRRVHWLRLIVDEGHSMASEKADFAILARDLRVNCRWICTGTPTPNLAQLEATEWANVTTQDSDRLYGMLTSFLQIGPFDNDFKTVMTGVVEHAKLSSLSSESEVDSPSGSSSSTSSVPWTLAALSSVARLRSLLDKIMIRNRHEVIEREVALPQLYERVVHLDLNLFQVITLNAQIALIQANAVLSQRQDEDYFFHERNTRPLAQVIQNLNACCFWYPGGDEFRGYLEEALKNVTEEQQRQQRPDVKEPYSEQDLWLLQEVKLHLQLALDNTAWLKVQHKKEIAYYCRNIPVDLQKHVLVPEHELGFSDGVCLSSGPHLEEVRKLVASQLNSDSIDGGQLPQAQLRPQPQPPIQVNGTEIPPGDNGAFANYMKERLSSAVIESSTSSKLNYIVSQILQFEGREKCIVFCQSDNAIYYVREYLHLAKIRCLEYHSKMRLSDRSSVITTFMSSENVVALIMDVKSAAYGINLPCASRVYFVSPVWEAAKKRQAIKRAHRIGQLRPVYVETLVIRNSFEQMILDRSNEKDVEPRREQQFQQQSQKDTVSQKIKKSQNVEADSEMRRRFQELAFYPMPPRSSQNTTNVDGQSISNLEIPLLYQSRKRREPDRTRQEDEEDIVIEPSSRRVRFALPDDVAVEEKDRARIQSVRFTGVDTEGGGRQESSDEDVNEEEEEEEVEDNEIVTSIGDILQGTGDRYMESSPSPEQEVDFDLVSDDDDDDDDGGTTNSSPASVQEQKRTKWYRGEGIPISGLPAVISTIPTAGAEPGPEVTNLRIDSD
ncbi:hypothetical protein BGZ83_008416 [Gryganskiella cystojenkinii]|nr:hypothetical protein BGZ83_008416 [Gryganskiella cystojenkinii]